MDREIETVGEREGDRKRVCVCAVDVFGPWVNDRDEWSVLTELLTSVLSSPKVILLSG